jgi:hypothetical protein
LSRENANGKHHSTTRASAGFIAVTILTSPTLEITLTTEQRLMPYEAFAQKKGMVEFGLHPIVIVNGQPT